MDLVVFKMNRKLLNNIQGDRRKMKCNDCNRSFDEPSEKETSYENYYGVSSEFSDSTPLTIEVCPYCGSEDIEEDEDAD